VKANYKIQRRDAIMKKYFETAPNFDGLKERIIILKDGEDKKTLFAVIALVTAVLIAVTVGVVYLLKTKMDDEYEEDWDYDWDDLEEDFCEDECCCTDSDVDDSVKVEQA
jgi:hypothetical protein